MHLVFGGPAPFGLPGTGPRREPGRPMVLRLEFGERVSEYTVGQNLRNGCSQALSARRSGQRVA
jgi:hypothetical protein